MIELTLTDLFGEGTEIINNTIIINNRKFIYDYNTLNLKELGFQSSDMNKIFGETAFIKGKTLFFYVDDVLIPDVLVNGWLIPLCSLFGCNTFEILK